MSQHRVAHMARWVSARRIVYAWSIQRMADWEEPKMGTIAEAKNLADLYDLPLVDWSAVTARLDQGVTQAPGTGGPDRHTC